MEMHFITGYREAQSSSMEWNTWSTEWCAKASKIKISLLSHNGLDQQSCGVFAAGSDAGDHHCHQPGPYISYLFLTFKIHLTPMEGEGVWWSK